MKREKSAFSERRIVDPDNNVLQLSNVRWFINGDMENLENWGEPAEQEDAKEIAYQANGNKLSKESESSG